MLFAHAAQAWANIGHALGNALGDDNIGPGSDRVRKQYWAKFGATREVYLISSMVQNLKRTSESSKKLTIRW